MMRGARSKLGIARDGIVLAALFFACNPPGSSSQPHGQGEPGAEAADACPAKQPAPDPLPGVRPEHRTLAYWLDRSAHPDAIVLSAEAIADHNAALIAHAAHNPAEPVAPYDLVGPVDPTALKRELDERLTFLREHVDKGEYVDADGRKLDGDFAAALATPAALPALAPELRVALGDIPLRCGPRPEAFYKGPEVDPDFDRNACSTIRAQEPVQILARWGAMRLARTRYAYGWIADAAPLSPPVARELVETVTRGRRARVKGRMDLRSDSGAVLTVADKTLLPERDGRLLFATTRGLEQSQPLDAAQILAAERPLTRRALLEEAFAYLDTPYGWGDHGGGRDCSRFLMDVFAAFGLQLPRHSAMQARAGSMSIDLTKVKAESDRLALLDAAAERGVVLLHFPGHIMLYLGRSREGAPMVMHAFAEYLEACAAGDAGRTETLRRVDRIQVSDLTLGRGTSRTSLFERITHVTILGETPGLPLAGVVSRRAPAPLAARDGECKDSADVPVFVTPRHPHPGAPLRVLVPSERDLGSVELLLEAPNGETLRPALHRTGGPPWGYWGEVSAPAAGKWTAQLGEGRRREACWHFTVHAEPPKRQAGEGSVWASKRKWNRSTENLYALFVEQLFDYPVEQDLTWPRLQVLLQNRGNNLLFGHLGENEEARLDLEPDCADLPYFLRAYFAWKMRLPFAFHHCNRGEGGRVPFCDREVHGNLNERKSAGEVEAFSAFVRDDIANGVHSGSGRTGPRDDNSDYYPVPLRRDAIRPGTAFHDPYGHVLIVAKWVPQTFDGYGILLGAEAQPDGLVGRRRFWRGSFLFTADTRTTGPGFKNFRPVVLRGGRLVPLANAAIGDGLTPFAEDQYQNGTDGFYDAMDALINPRPLDARRAMGALVDALDEQATRRVPSVQNGVDYQRGHPGTIDMPRGHAIFETTGAWEDFSTPSRDMRLLIAIDTVLGFPESVKRRPERFGLAASGADAAAAELATALTAELHKRRFAYQRSDGSSFELSLADVAARAPAFELAYNPNDCVEIRWGAADGSPEESTCQRRAPAHQRRLMDDYRRWFATRTRPPR